MTSNEIAEYPDCEKPVVGVNQNTGEVIPLYKYTTVRQHETWMKLCADNRERLAESDKIEAKKMAREAALNGLNFEYVAYGTFVWFMYTPLTELNLGVSGLDIVRLMYLSTYLDYQNVLRTDNNRAIKLTDFPSLLDISERSAKYFISALKRNDIMFQDENGNLKLNGKIFYRGKVKQPKECGIQTIRIYIETVRSLYLNTSKKERNRLLYVFKLIPYVNRHYNIVCKNVFEENMDNVQRLTLDEFCNVIDYDKSNIARLKAELSSITLNGKYIIAFLSTKNVNKSMICVSPAVFYAGSNNEVIKMLLGYFDEQDEVKATKETKKAKRKKRN